MTILTRYLLREFSRAAAACLAVALALFLAIDFVEEANRLFRHHVAVHDALRYYFWRLPDTFVLVSPVAILLATLVTVSLRARSNEITAMFSGGVSVARLCAPVLAGCAAVTLLSLGTSELLAPAANRKAREFVRRELRPGEVAAQFSMNRYWVRGETGILSAQVIDPAHRSLQGFQYLQVDGAFRPVRRVEARTAAYSVGAWTLRDGTERRLSGDLRAEPFRERRLVIPETIEGFLNGETPPEEMTWWQLSGYIGEARARGYDTGRYEVDLHAKLSYPLLNVIVSLLAIPLALRAPRTGGVWRSAGTGLLIGFACWVLLSTSLSLGRMGALPPALAAWLPDLLFLGAGAALFRHARR